jgi:hypothetical protein
VDLINSIHLATDIDQRRQRALRAGEHIELFATRAAREIRPEHRGRVVLPFNR